MQWFLVLQFIKRLYYQLNRSIMKQSKHEELPEESFINIKIKTLNNSIYQIIVNPLKAIKTFQTQLQQKTKVPIEAQRLLYRGFVLDSEKTLADYRIEEGNIIQLVANKLPSEFSYQSSLKKTQFNKNNLYSRQYNKTKKFRQLQQRMNGFRLKKQQSLEVIQQNKHVIDQLLECVNLNFLLDVTPFLFERRKIQIGQWIDVRDGSGQWIEGQVINQYGEYVLVHYNGMDNRWNEWISASSERLMPFRTHTVQTDKYEHMSPMPIYERSITSKNNTKFKNSIQGIITQVSATMDNLNALLKELEFDHIEEEENDESLKNVSNIETNLLYNQQSQQESNTQEIEDERKEEFQTPNKQNLMLGDNLSNKCQDDRSNANDNDDMSSKSYKSKRSEGLVDTASMKSLIIDEARKRQNKVFYDRGEEAQSVRSVHNKKSKRRENTLNQEYILEEEDSQINDQQFEELGILKQKELKRKMKASQLAPLLDRMGRLLIDLAPHVAMIGHLDQSNGNHNQNLSTYTNQGSLLSKMSNLNKNNLNPLTNNININSNNQITNTSSQINSTTNIVQEPIEEDKLNSSYCYFQVPVMLTPSEVKKLHKIIQEERKNLHNL